MPTIPGCVCNHCGKTYTAHKYGSQYCGRSCATTAQMERRFAHIHTERTCPGCGKKWKAPPSNSSNFCSKKCIFDSGKWQKPKEYECANCGSKFEGMADRASHKHRYCSKRCYTDHKPMQDERVCIECGKSFKVNTHRTDKVCGLECRDAHYIRDRSPAWKGGLVLQAERPSRRIDRDGYVGNYEGEHRLIASREIGRPLKRGEAVICLDGDNLNMDPSNLFLCPNRSESGLIIAGSVEWPASSNLSNYKESGYVRPSVLITLHDWKNGERRTSKNGKPITRHPQADEIIKRRLAGASIRTLAKEFENSLSTMAKTVKNRL